jgi:hypothetical protein
MSFNPNGGGGNNTGFTGIGMPGGAGQYTPPPMTNMNSGGMMSPLWDRFNQNMGGNTGIAGGLMNRPEGGGLVGPTPGIIGGMDQGRMGDMYRRGKIQTMF